MAVQRRQRRLLGKEARHRRVQLDQRDLLDAGVFEDLAHRHAVAAAQHGHLARRAEGAHGRVHQGLVVAVLVAFGELQVAVQKEPVARAPLARVVGDDDALVGRGLGDHRAVGVEVVLGQRGHALGQRKGHRQHRQHPQAGGQVRAAAAQLVPEQPQRPQRHQRVHQPEQQPRAHQPQVRRQQQREGQADGQRAQVVEGQHLRHQLPEPHVAPQDAHHQRNLEPHQRAHRQHQPVQREAEAGRRPGVGQVQQQRHQPAGQRHQQLDAQKVRRQLPVEEARQVRADAHREQVGADHGGELQHRIAQHVAGQCTRHQFVQQPAGGDHEHAGQQRHFHGLRPAAGSVGGVVQRCGGDVGHGGGRWALGRADARTVT